jgi:type 1 fimbria pilin
MTDVRLPMVGVFGRNAVRSVLLALSLGFGSVGALAKCTIDPSVSTFVFNLDMGSVVISPDSPVGSVIASKRFPRGTGSTKVGSCRNGGNAHYQVMQGTPVPGFDGVFSTGVRGIGIRLTFNPGDVAPFTFPGQVRYSGNVDVYLVPSSYYDVELIKTEPTTGSGPLTSGEVGRSVFDTDTKPFSSIFIPANGVTIVTPSCTVDTGSRNIVVQMGKVRKSAFNGVGSSAGAKPFNIQLNCNAGNAANNTIYLRMDATPDPSGQQGVLQVAQVAGAAGGVGIQVLDKDSVGVKFAEEALVGPSKDGSYVLPFTARYLQTAPTVSVGPANGTATFSIIYK